MPSCSGIQNVNQKLQVQYTIVMTAMIISGWITDDCEYVAFFLITGLPELCVFSANYAPKIPNYVQIMRIVQYCTIFLRKNSQCFNLLRLQINHKHLISGPEAVCPQGSCHHWPNYALRAKLCDFASVHNSRSPVIRSVDQNSRLSVKGFEVSSHVFLFKTMFWEISNTRRYAIPFFGSQNVCLLQVYTTKSCQQISEIW